MQAPESVSIRNESPVGKPWPHPRQAWWAVFVFSVTLAASYLDRGVLNLLVEPIKRDLLLTDTQVSLLMGFAFIAFYLVLGLPVARWIDGGNRRLSLGLAATTWSVATMLCGLAGNFWQLALCRVGVGAGDAAVAPGIGSMIADLFPRERLARAMSLMGLAFVAGNGLALLLGGLIIGALTKLGPMDLPLIGRMYPWQATFFIVGLPGVLAAALYLTVREPERRGGAGNPSSEGSSIRATLSYLGHHRGVYAPMFIGLALSSIVSSGAQSWTPTFFARTYGWTPAQFGAAAGALSLCLSPIGILTGFRFAELLHARGYDDANLRLAAICAWLMAPLTILVPLMPTPEIALVPLILGSIVGVAPIGAQNAALLMITPNRMRAQMTALFLVMFNVIGYGCGPTLVALVTDYVFGSEASLRWAMLSVAAILAPLGATALTLGLKPFALAAARTRGW